MIKHNHIRPFALALAIVTVGGCAAVKSVLRTADDAAQILCELFGQEHPEEFEQLVRSSLPPGSLASAERDGFNPAVLCGVREVFAPFVDHVMSVQRSTAAGIRAGMERGE